MVKNDAYLGTLYTKNINPVSIDLTLGTEAQLSDWPWWYQLLWYITKKDKWRKRVRNISTVQGFWLRPGQMVLLHSAEHVSVPTNVAALLTLKSSRGREGFDHALAGWFDAGFEGDAVFEVYAHAFPVWVHAGMKFAQLIYMDAEPPQKPYDGHYQHQKGAVPSWQEK